MVLSNVWVSSSNFSNSSYVIKKYVSLFRFLSLIGSSHVVSTAYKLLVGDNRDLYIKFLKKNSDGKIDPVMRFINPYNNEKNALDNDTELEFLEVILWNINRFRIPTGERES
jgi:hypothetical protein